MSIRTRMAQAPRPAAGRTAFPRLRRKGQALVETALMGVLLMMLLAAAVDFGRAYYTAVVVANMAGEGASYAALYPSLEFGNGNCSRIPVTDNISIQQRARLVAKARGLVIDAEDQRNATIAVDPSDCSRRCAGTSITVQVTYHLNDLFLPGLVGVRDIPIHHSASQTITRNPDMNHTCDE